MKVTVFLAFLIGLAVFSVPAMAQKSSLRTDQVRGEYVPPKEEKHKLIYGALRERPAIALAENLDCIIGMDQLSASAQRQFNATLREIERHRQTLGLSVRPAGLPSVEPKVKVLHDPKDIA